MEENRRDGTSWHLFSNMTIKLYNDIINLYIFLYVCKVRISMRNTVSFRIETGIHRGVHGACVLYIYNNDT